jgi:microsomal dipeptidase-like Zn-dependent dipeptidase
MPELFADIHCHSSTKAFYTQRGDEALRIDPFQTARNNIKSKILNQLRDLIERVSEIKLGTQSNFDNLFDGGHRVVIVSLTPPEKAFFILNQAPEKFITTNLRSFAEFKKVPFEGTIKDTVVNAFTGFSINDIAFCKRTGLDYYNDLLKKEYEFLKSFDNKKSEKGYRLKLVKSFSEIEVALNEDPNTICVILSIEGAHSLGKSYGYGDLLRSQGKSHKDDPPGFNPNAATTTRDYVVNIADLKKWEYPPLFISLFHHVWNDLGGHARSMNRMMTVLINQEEGINLGINETGKLVVKELLSKKNGKRILVDIKHMSPRSRKDYYRLLKQDEELRNDRIPIVCSHTGVVTKRTTIDQMIDLSDNDDWKELNEEFGKNYLHECSINLCAEDILNINESKGLIGIQLDEKRIAGKGIIKAIRDIKGATIEQVNIQYAKVVLANIFRIVQVVDKKEAWDIVCIGSDFDGIINHLDSCPTSKEVPELKSTLLTVLNNKLDISQMGFNYSISAEEIQRLHFGYTSEEILQKVFYNNVLHFLRLNF